MPGNSFRRLQRWLASRRAITEAVATILVEIRRYGLTAFADHLALIFKVRATLVATRHPSGVTHRAGEGDDVARCLPARGRPGFSGLVEQRAGRVVGLHAVRHADEQERVVGERLAGEERHRQMVAWAAMPPIDVLAAMHAALLPTAVANQRGQALKRRAAAGSWLAPLLVDGADRRPQLGIEPMERFHRRSLGDDLARHIAQHGNHTSGWKIVVGEVDQPHASHLGQPIGQRSSGLGGANVFAPPSMPCWARANS